ncbi:MAG: hypothetical protein HOW73_17155 [Polyangiaceae bacterium]|nr:hypothetical protein [Polyangiaceae bacterium]
MSFATLPELEAIAARLNAENEEGPAIYLDDRDAVIGMCGEMIWADLLSERIEQYNYLRVVARARRAGGEARAS